MNQLQRDLVNFHPTASNFHQMWNQAIKHSQDCIKKAHEYDKLKWDKSHKIPNFEVGNKVLISTLNFRNL